MSKGHNILGIGGLWHEGSVFYLNTATKEYRYIALERLTRNKYSGIGSLKDVELLIDRLGIKNEDIDMIAWGGIRDFAHLTKPGLQTLGEWVKQKPVTIVDHHHAHQAASFFTSGFDNAILLSIDESGDAKSMRLGIGEGSTIRDLGAVEATFSIGRLWEAFNFLIGYEPENSSGKSMALSAFGKSLDALSILREIVSYQEEPPHLPRLSKQISSDAQMLLGHTYTGNVALATYISNKTGLRILNKSESRELGTINPDYQSYYDLALCLQSLTCEIIESIVTRTAKETGITKVCLSGGVALNVVANSRLLELKDITAVHVPPLCSDAGLSAGAALFAANQIQPVMLDRFSPYLGPLYTDDEIESRLKQHGLTYTKVDQEKLVIETANLLSNGRIIGWYQGRSEAGPRALGNRSILAHPGNGSSKTKINDIIKKREPYRPFAPVAIVESARNYFSYSPKLTESPYMLFNVWAKHDATVRLSDVLHADNTARLQTVSSEQNPTLYDLLKEFEKLTSLPVLLNTSFNGPSEPIVETPNDAINCYLEHSLDALVIGPFIVTRS